MASTPFLRRPDVATIGAAFFSAVAAGPSAPGMARQTALPGNGNAQRLKILRLRAQTLCGFFTAQKGGPVHMDRAAFFKTVSQSLRPQAQIESNPSFPGACTSEKTLLGLLTVRMMQLWRIMRALRQAAAFSNESPAQRVSFERILLSHIAGLFPAGRHRLGRRRTEGPLFQLRHPGDGGPTRGADRVLQRPGVEAGL